MRFMMLVMGNSDYEAGKPPSPEMGREFMQLHIDVLGPSFDGALQIRAMAG